MGGLRRPRRYASHMQPRRHRMRQRQRRNSARDWIRTAAAVTVAGYSKRYGVDRYTAYADLTALGVALPESAQRWALRPAATPRRPRRPSDEEPDENWIALDGGLFFVVGYTPGGAPYGIFADQIPHDDDATAGARPPSAAGANAASPARTRTRRGQPPHPAAWSGGRDAR